MCRVSGLRIVENEVKHQLENEMELGRGMNNCVVKQMVKYIHK